MALSADRALDMMTGPVLPQFEYGVHAGYRVYRNSLVWLLADGSIVPAGIASPPAAAVKVVGLADHLQDNTGMLPTPIGSGLSGPGPVRCLRGCWALPFDTAPGYASVGASVYALDDQTVTLTAPSSGAATLAVGVLEGFDLDGRPFVQI